MSVDREQIRRDAEAFRAVNPGDSEGAHDELYYVLACLALLDELEQAEKDRNEAQFDAQCALLPEAQQEIARLESRLSRVPALVEALELIRNSGLVRTGVSGYDEDKSTGNPMGKMLAEIAQEALAAFEGEQ